MSDVVETNMETSSGMLMAQDEDFDGIFPRELLAGLNEEFVTIFENNGDILDEFMRNGNPFENVHFNNEDDDESQAVQEQVEDVAENYNHFVDYNNAYDEPCSSTDFPRGNQQAQQQYVDLGFQYDPMGNDNFILDNYPAQQFGYNTQQYHQAYYGPDSNTFENVPMGSQGYPVGNQVYADGTQVYPVGAQGYPVGTQVVTDATHVQVETKFVPTETASAPAVAEVVPAAAQVVPVEAQVAPVEAQIVPVEAQVVPAESSAESENVAVKKKPVKAPKKETKKRASKPLDPKKERAREIKCIINGRHKPGFPYACLVGLALKNAPSNRLSVSQIYHFVLYHFPFYEVAPTGWKNSIRHNLSLNTYFNKIIIEKSGNKMVCVWRLRKQRLHILDTELRKQNPDQIRLSMRHPELYESVVSGTEGMPPKESIASLIAAEQKAKAERAAHLKMLRAAAEQKKQAELAAAAAAEAAAAAAAGEGSTENVRENAENVLGKLLNVKVEAASSSSNNNKTADEKKADKRAKAAEARLKRKYAASTANQPQSSQPPVSNNVQYVYAANTQPVYEPMTGNLYLQLVTSESGQHYYTPIQTTFVSQNNAPNGLLAPQYSYVQTIQVPPGNNIQSFNQPQRTYFQTSAPVAPCASSAPPVKIRKVSPTTVQTSSAGTTPNNCVGGSSIPITGRSAVTVKPYQVQGSTITRIVKPVKTEFTNTKPMENRIGMFGNFTLKGRKVPTVPLRVIRPVRNDGSRILNRQNINTLGANRKLIITKKETQNKNDSQTQVNKENNN